MAEEEREDRTEEPSGRRIAKAWEEGKIPLGHDAPMVASLAAGCLALFLTGPSIRTGLVQVVSEAARASDRSPFAILPALLSGPALGVAGVCAAAAAAAAAAVLAQTRGGFWPHMSMPDLERLWQGGRLNLFRKELWVDLGLSAVKVLALGWAAYTAVRADFVTLPVLLSAAPGDQLALTGRILGRAALRLLLAAGVVAGLDLAIQHLRFKGRMKMTKDEMKREAKEDEGDPVHKGRRKKRHREISRGRASIEVPRADVLLVNPTHVAVAIRYRRDEGRAPRVLAKGKGVLAEYMRDLARRHGVPIVEDVPLARLLCRKVKVGGEIPAATYRAVAAVLAFVYRLGQRPREDGVRA